MKNIVLIGMPSSGKTTIGKMLAKESSMLFFDADEVLEKLFDKSIPDIFAEEGEEGFRRKETTVIKDLSRKDDSVLSCGGGVVLKEENMKNLKKNGVVFFIKRNVEKLSCEGRPLSKDLETLKKMEKVRLPLYEKYADYTIENDESIEKAVKEIWEKYNEDLTH